QQSTQECPSCYHHLAESLACRGLLTKAIYCWQRALELDEEYPFARQRIAEAYRARRELDKALEFYLSAVRHDPGNTHLLCETGDLLIEKGDLDAAAAKFQHVADLDPESARARMMLGLIASRQDRPED